MSKLASLTLKSLLLAAGLASATVHANALPADFDLGIEAAINDAQAQQPQTGALYMFGVGGLFGSASALVFANNSGRFYSVPGGSIVTGEVAVGVADSTSAAQILDASRRFQLNMQFTARGTGLTASPSTGDGFGGPKQELKPGAYVGAGGSIDPATWSFFDLTSASLVGLDDFAGISIALSQMPANSEFPFQYGDGASGRTTRSSGSMWFDWVITTASNTLLGPVGRSGTGDVYFQGRCANDSATANAMGLGACSASVPSPASLALLSAGLLGLVWQARRRKPA